ncbi:hypothetical protein KTJ63_02130 [Acinetobacter baumannii]|uniref:Uncharacterized protein n=1 Tax=Acinetobacter baumannii TaxID=470 RepID=A0A241ZG41_ACIBA|nr:hypothetical protein [Acinetobacter baumannii]AJB67995.1 hypothetical protein RU84_14300 [Acinetobacter baumannii]MCT9545638.1 hypothetical protein [Acinetobacter baumannii]MCY6389805.1 hypothetical protein [Acinetobacter baumannii]OTM90939.1 hypothetical protein B9X95_05850 [Acinetobacter baumannii]
MTDLNKEREAFLNTFQYYKGRRDIIFSHEHELFMTRSNNPSDIAQKEISNMNSRWDAWLRCAKHRDAELEKAKAQAVPEKKIYLTCEQLYAAANFGAPNKDPELLETELTIAWFDEAHSGSGYYVYISEYPEEGAMKLESELGAEG